MTTLADKLIGHFFAVGARRRHQQLGRNPQIQTVAGRDERLANAKALRERRNAKRAAGVQKQASAR